MTIWVAMPVFNEGPRIGRLLDRWLGVLTGEFAAGRIVVVDDGSTDETPEVLAEYARTGRVEVVTHEANMGLGRTLRDCLRVVADRGAAGDVVVMMDGDGTHPPEMLGEMMRCQRATGCDVVIASRFRRGARVEGVGAFRTVTSVGARVLFGLICPMAGVRDYTCGFRLYRVALIQQAWSRLGERFCSGRGFECTAQILLQLGSLGARFAEVPLTLDYSRKRGSSNMRPFWTVWTTLRLMLFHRFGGRR